MTVMLCCCDLCCCCCLSSSSSNRYILTILDLNEYTRGKCIQDFYKYSNLVTFSESWGLDFRCLFLTKNLALIWLYKCYIPHYRNLLSSSRVGTLWSVAKAFTFNLSSWKKLIIFLCFLEIAKKCRDARVVVVRSLSSQAKVGTIRLTSWDDGCMIWWHYLFQFYGIW